MSRCSDRVIALLIPILVILCFAYPWLWYYPALGTIAAILAFWLYKFLAMITEGLLFELKLRKHRNLCRSARENPNPQ